MKISYSPYTLKPLFNLSAVGDESTREGVLIKVEWADGLVGYADLHPWPELGDLPLESQFSRLRDGKMTAQIEQSIWLANRDAKARKKNRSFFEGRTPVRNNYIISDLSEIRPGLLDEVKAHGFTNLKLKVGRDLVAEAEFLYQAAAAGLKIRLDFNGVGNWQMFEKFISQMPTVIPSIEYVEDPFPFDEAAWRDAQKLVKVAIDNQYEKVNWDKLREPSFDVIVIKPAKIDVDQAVARCRKWHLKAVVTSYMDHPVGSMHALAIAMELKEQYEGMVLDAGCLTHRLYHMNSFSAEVTTQGPYIKKVRGMGVGFDRLLEGLPWYQLKFN